MSAFCLEKQADDYPDQLRQTPHPPARLYGLGSREFLPLPALGVVGSRSMSPYGERIINLLLPAVASAGIVIVSGLAYGVDAAAHRTALRHGGRCVAVLGSGIDVIYPASNRPLLEAILQSGGCVLSEYPEGTQPASYQFPERNRIVAGLSKAVLIIEAGERSGTLITARHALDAGREVCVVPADITREQSKGVHSLLKQGARPVTTPGDLLALFGTPGERVVPEHLQPALTGSPANLYDLISHGAGTVDQLSTASGLSVGEVQSVLSVLELDGYIYLNGTTWQRTY